MILVAIIALSGVVLAALAVVLVGLPDFPISAQLFMTWFEEIIRDGIGFIKSFLMYPGFVVTLLTILITGYTVYTAYKLIMWVVKKIPMFGVSD